MSRWQTLVAMANQQCTQLFGLPIVYTPSVGGGAIHLLGIFDEKRETATLMGGGGLDIATTHSLLEIKISDLGIDPTVSDTVVINDQTFRVMEVLLPGMGMAVLVVDRTQ